MANEISEIVYPDKIDLKEVIKETIPEVIPNFDLMVTFFKAVGVLFVIYFIYFLISQFYIWRRNRRINKIYHKIDDIDGKLDLIIKKIGSKYREKKVSKKSKKK